MKPVFLVSSFSEGLVAQPAVRDSFINAVHAKAQGTPKLTYIPTASYAVDPQSKLTQGQQRQRARRDGKQRRDRIVQVLGACDAATLDLMDGSIKGWPSSPEDALENADCVFVDGGNTFWLRAHMESYMDLLRDSKAVYVGVSAGAIVAGLTSATALWKGWDDPSVVEPRDWLQDEALSLVPFSFFPHYTAMWDPLVDDMADDATWLLHEHGAFVRLDGTSTYYLDNKVR